MRAKITQGTTLHARRIRFASRLADGSVDWAFYRTIAFFACFLSFWCSGWKAESAKLVGFPEFFALVSLNLGLIGLQLLTWAWGSFRTNYPPYSFDRWEDYPTFQRHILVWGVFEFIALNPVSLGWPIWMFWDGIVMMLSHSV